MDVFVDSLKVALLGISVTFVMLLLIVGFVKILKPCIDFCIKTGELIKKGFRMLFKRKKQRQTEVVYTAASPDKPDAANDVRPDGAEIAAIMAAVACAAGISQDMFVLKSIKRSKAGAWRGR